MTKLFIAVGMLVAGCSSLQAPNLLDPGKEPAPALELSDARIFRFSDELVKWWGLRSMHAEVFGVGTGIAMDAMTTAAVAASGGRSLPGHRPRPDRWGRLPKIGIPAR